MVRNRPAYDLAESLWNVTVSFVLYVALLIVVNRAQAGENGLEVETPGWQLQDLGALFLGIWALCNIVGYLIMHCRRPLWLVVGVAQILAAAGLYKMQEENWLWLALNALAIAIWAYAFQVSIAAVTSEAPNAVVISEQAPEAEEEEEEEGPPLPLS
ncbi:MAG: hypothetical protein GX100_09425 [candidate division WS1 bacterium]|jgi:nicotinamide riboside transporter PnuC|nr:hypothetical protein [candidate division WS1 bacterium]